MTKQTTRGYLRLDKGVYSRFQKAAQNCGWKVERIPQSVRDYMGDDTIASKYGKGRYGLITYDKTAYTNNTTDGFIGYIEYDEVSKNEFEELALNFEKVISSVKSKDIEGYRLIIHKDTYEKEPLSKESTKKQKTRKLAKKWQKRRR